MLDAHTGAPYKPDPQSPKTATREAFGIAAAAAGAVCHLWGRNFLYQVNKLLAHPSTSCSSNCASNSPEAPAATLFALSDFCAIRLCRTDANPSSGAARTPGTF